AGPTQPIQLQWATYYDAADQAGLFRIWGGIHPPVDDFAGRRAGVQCGSNVWALARSYFDGSVTNTSITLAMRSLNPIQCELRYNTLRGFYYKLQSILVLGQSFADDGPGLIQVLESSAVCTNIFVGAGKLFWVVRAFAF